MCLCNAGVTSVTRHPFGTDGKACTVFNVELYIYSFLFFFLFKSSVNFTVAFK